MKKAPVTCATGAFFIWFTTRKHLECEFPAWELVGSYAAASFLAGDMVVFSVKGNRYRLEVVVAYATEVVVIEWIGTHSAYDRRNRQRRRRN